MKIKCNLPIIYKIYTEINLAETSRDPDNIITKYLCNKKTKESTIAFCEKYILEHFCDKSTKLEKNTNGFSATDFCSYAETLIAKKTILEN